MLDRDFGRPDYEAAMAFVDRHADPGDVVVDGVSLAPGGVPSAIDLAFAGAVASTPSGAPRSATTRSGSSHAPPPTPDVVRRAAAAARGRRLFMLLAPDGPPTREALAAVPAGYRRVAARRYAGINRIEVLVFEPQTASGA